MCNRNLVEKDVRYLYDEFSAKVEPVCKYCGFRLIILHGLSRLFMHGWRQVP